MGKAAKPAKGSKGSQNRPIVARTAFLYRAMKYLSTEARIVPPARPNEHNNTPPSDAMVDIDPSSPVVAAPSDPPQPPEIDVPLMSHLSNHFRLISQKALIRQPQSMKRSICKRCGILLTPDCASVEMSNNSKKGRKWADVLVLRCGICGVEKRFPVGNKFQTRRKVRNPDVPRMQKIDDGAKDS